MRFHLGQPPWPLWSALVGVGIAAVLNIAAWVVAARGRPVVQVRAPTFVSMFLWSVGWAVPLTLRTTHLISVADYYVVVAWAAPFIFAIGPWSLPALHFLVAWHGTRKEIVKVAGLETCMTRVIVESAALVKTTAVETAITSVLVESEDP